MTVSIFSVLVVLVAIGVPLAVLAAAHGLARYADWARTKASRRRIAFFVIAAAYVVAAIVFVAFAAPVLQIISTLALAAGFAFVGWYEGGR